MKRFARNVLILTLAGLAAACSREAPLRQLPAEAETYSFEHGGRTRRYILLEPGLPADSGDRPLVLSLHGGGGSPDDACGMRAGVGELVQSEQFFVACPGGIGDHWNDGRSLERYQAHRENVDDVGFLLALVDDLAGRYPIDLDRVYVTGASNGGMMSYRMACDAADRIAAIAPVIANLPATINCDPSQPIPVIVINGTEDPLMPYDGGQVHFGRQQLGAVLSTADTVAFWVGANGCDPAAQETYLEDTVPNDGTRLRRETYAGCQAGAEVILYEVIGGGHTWPGGGQYAPRAVIGITSREANAGQLIWHFFQAH